MPFNNMLSGARDAFAYQHHYRQTTHASARPLERELAIARPKEPIVRPPRMRSHSENEDSVRLLPINDREREVLDLNFSSIAASRRT